MRFLPSSRLTADEAVDMLMRNFLICQEEDLEIYWQEDGEELQMVA